MGIQRFVAATAIWLLFSSALFAAETDQQAMAGMPSQSAEEYESTTSLTPTSIEVEASKIVSASGLFESLQTLRKISSIGYSPESVDGYLYTLPKNNFTPPSQDDVSEDDVVIQSGVKNHREIDFFGYGEMPLSMVRTYNTGNWLNQNILGKFWSSDFDKRLIFSQLSQGLDCGITPWGEVYYSCQYLTIDQYTHIAVWRENGTALTFTYNANKGYWTDSKGDNSISRIVREADDSWTLYFEDNMIEHYSSLGAPLWFQNQFGIKWTFNYSDSKRLMSVTHSSGRKVQFWWTGNQVTSITAPDGASYGYTYDRFDYLSKATYPGGANRSYFYEYLGMLPGGIAAVQGYFLTGTAANGVRLTTTSYQRTNLGDNVVKSVTYANGKKTTHYVSPMGLQSTSASVTNASGLKLEYTYGARRPVFDYSVPVLTRIGRPATSTTPAGNKVIAYDPNWNRDYVVDWNGNRTDYSYDASGRLLTKIVNGRTTNYYWDTSFNRITDVYVYEGVPNGGTCAAPNRCTPNVPFSARTHFDYYSQASSSPNRLKLVSVTQNAVNGRPLVTRYTAYNYVLNSNQTIAALIIDTRPYSGGSATTYGYDEKGNLLSITNALGHSIKFSGYNGAGRPSTFTDANGVSTDIGFDGRNNITSMVTHATSGDQISTATYTALNKISSFRSPSGASLSYGYDANGFLVSLSELDTDFGGEASAPCGYEEKVRTKQRVFTYDSLGNIGQKSRRLLTEDWRFNTRIEECLPYNTSAIDASIGFTYDTAGRLRSKVGNNGQSTTYTRDGNGNVLTATDAMGRVTTNTYDSENKLLTSKNPIGGVAVYSYDGLGNLKSITDPRGKVTNYVMSIWGKPIRIESPDTGVTTYTYNDSGMLTSMTRSNGSVTSYSYDAADRLISVSSGADIQSTYYDTCTYGLGRVCKLEDGSGSTSYNYNSVGQMTSQSSDISGSVYSTIWTYDTYGRLSTLTYPGGVKLIYAYNGNNEVKGLSALVNGVNTAIVSNIQYRPFGPLASMVYGNGITHAITRDVDSRITKIISGSVENLTFSYTSANELATITNNINSALSQSYTTDSLSRIKTITTNSSTDTYFYDANGNRTQINLAAYPSSPQYYETNSSNNQLASISLALKPTRTYSYDSIGNLILNKPNLTDSRCFGYDAFNNLTSYRVWANSQPCGSAAAPVKNVVYRSNALRQRAQKEVGGAKTKFVYTPSHQLLVETETNSVMIERSYIWLGTQLVGFVKNGAVYFVHNDQADRPDTVTNSGKTVVWRASNFAFGRLVSYDAVGGLNIGYPGQYQDNESGLWYNWHRYYDATIGRYIQSDPLGLEGGLNTYIYANQNPLKNIDPTGLLNILVGGGGSFVPVFGGGGSFGIYLSLSRETGIDIGVFGTGERGAGGMVGLNGIVGYVPGNRHNIAGKGTSYNLSGAPFSVTYTENKKGEFSGVFVGPAAEWGGSVMDTQTVTYGTQDLATDIVDLLYEVFGDKVL